MTDFELRVAILKIAGDMNLLFDPPHEIDSIEKLAHTARIRGRNDVLEIVRAEFLKIDEKTRRFEDSKKALLYMIIAQKVTDKYGVPDLITIEDLNVITDLSEELGQPQK